MTDERVVERDGASSRYYNPDYGITVTVPDGFRKARQRAGVERRLIRVPLSDDVAVEVTIRGREAHNL